MLETNESLLKEINETLIKAISAIRDEPPYIFFSEGDLQYYFYSFFHGNQRLGKDPYSTKDGRVVKLTHSEYGAKQAFYDMVILNPNFIENNLYEHMTGRTVNKSITNEKDALITILELKYFPEKSNRDLRGLKTDYEKLSKTSENQHCYMVVFSLRKDDKFILEFIKDKNKIWNEHVHIIYINASFLQKDRKPGILIKPDNFLNLPQSWLLK
jgi:hypothetical protein